MKDIFKEEIILFLSEINFNLLSKERKTSKKEKKRLALIQDYRQYWRTYIHSLVVQLMILDKKFLAFKFGALFWVFHDHSNKRENKL